MAQALREAGVEFEEIDVDRDPALEARFGELVPVLTDAQGNELCHYRLEPGVLDKLR
jgi:thioredoxin reductase (NADPH)